MMNKNNKKVPETQGLTCNKNEEGDRSRVREYGKRGTGREIEKECVREVRRKKEGKMTKG